MNKMLNCLQYEVQYHHNHWIIIVLLTFLADASSYLLTKPENGWARNGDPNIVILKCNSTLKYRLSWLIKATNASTELLIFNGYRVSENVTSYCKVVKGEPGEYELNINATTKAAQQYACREPGTLMKASAELIVIESDPDCNVTNGGELTTFTCHILLHGRWTPVMECRNGKSGEVIGERLYNISTPIGGLTSRLIVPSNQTKDSEIFFTCTTRFRLQERPSDTTADNIPHYNYTWNSTQYVGEPCKGTGDKAKGTSEANGSTTINETFNEPKVVVASSVVVLFVALVTVAGLWGLFYCKKRRTTNMNNDIPEEEIEKFFEGQQNVNERK